MKIINVVYCCAEYCPPPKDIHTLSLEPVTILPYIANETLEIQLRLRTFG